MTHFGTQIPSPKPSSPGPISARPNPLLIPSPPMADPPPSASLLLPDPSFDDLFPDGLALLPFSSHLRDLDFDIDDFLRSPDPHRYPPSPDPDSAADGSAVSSSSSPHQDPPGLDPRRPLSPDFGDSSDASGVAVAVDPEVKVEEEKAGWCLKRKMEKDHDEFLDSRADHNSNLNPYSRNSKFRRSEEASSPCIFGSGCEEEEKKRARLTRNRESSQLSRQRKKQYVEGLEEKVRLMHSTINELNSKISYIIAENVSLRQQLGGGASPPPAVYPPPGAIAPAHFGWIPGYALRPQGSQVPLVPIPRLKPQQPALAPKAKKSESKKGKTKTKKVASVSLLGLLFIMLIFGGAVPRVNLWYGGNKVDETLSKEQILSQAKGRIFTVRGHHNGLNSTDEIMSCSGKKGFGDGGMDRVTGRRCENVEVGPRVKPKGSSSWPSPRSEAILAQNSSESLPAFLYVPRNGKHVKINGKLIIHSVLASEKAMQQAKSRESSGNEIGLAAASNVMSALAISRAGQGADLQHSKSYGIGSDSDDIYANNSKSTSADGPLQQWFREGMAGPMLSSGMCTEVFKFDVSPSSSSSGIVPTSSIINTSSLGNASENLHPSSAHPGKIRNRRIMYPEPIPLWGAMVNNTEQFEESSESSNFGDAKPVSSVVVSVLADPREAGDGESDGKISSNSLSRIFVVVLVDSVKYVTYSCRLPLKTSATHLVN